MHSKLALVAATALVSLIPSTIALGKASIVNNCKDPVYTWSIAGSAAEEMIKLEPGESHTEEYRTNDNGGGISIKMSLEEDQGEVSQFEYTISEEESKVYYDLSNIDGYPFKDGGITITPSDDSCPSIQCPSGEPKCTEAYNQPYDDHATKGCPQDSDLAMNLCADKGSKMSRFQQRAHARHF